MTQTQGAGSKIRVLVVDDSAFVRRAIIRMFDGHPSISIIEVASDGAMAIEQIKQHRPDVVTLDVQMPILDGIAALERIMRECPTPVVMLSSLTGRGGDQTLKALDLGAVDFIDKSAAGGSMDISNLLHELTSKILTAARIDISKLVSKKSIVHSPLPFTVPKVDKMSGTAVVLIGVSTGGPPALQKILSEVPETFPVPILVVQHMPKGFTASLAERLNRCCAISVKEAQDGEIARPSMVYIAPGGFHLKLCQVGDNLQLKLDSKPDGTLHCPSVDVLFESAVGVCGKRTLAFVLTGMGRDGSVGAKALKLAGGRIVVESEETSVVFGMPKSVMEVIKVDAVVPLYAVAETMTRMV